MEMWIKVRDEKKKLQGSFRKVMEEIVKVDKEEITLLAVNSNAKELRKLKRLLRWHNKDLREVARQMLIKYYKSDKRKLKKRIEELKKRAKYISKGQVFYCKKIMSQVRELEKEMVRIDEKINALIGK